MSTRYEFIDAGSASTELWSAELCKHETDEHLDEGSLALTLAGDEVTVLVGTREQLRALVREMARTVEEEPEELEHTYRIRRFYRDHPGRDTDDLPEGLTLEEAQEWCNDPETSSESATSAAAKAVTAALGPWFDGYEKEDA